MGSRCSHLEAALMLAIVLLTTALVLVIAGPRMKDWYVKRIDR